MTGPLTVGADLLTALGIAENNVLRMSLASGAAKQHVVWPVNCAAWNETMDTLHDLHAAWEVRWDAENPEDLAADVEALAAKAGG